MFEKNLNKEKMEEDAQVSREELTALGIPTGISMTRGELNKHLETKRLQKAARENRGEDGMFAGLTDEEIDRAEKAAHERTQIGR